jgi:lipoprotein-anchoring transpeptidase ErfK/SrfK
VENITALPEFRWDEKMLKEGSRSNDALTLPPGPRNPVGVYWMGLNKKGIGMHGTDSPWTIGRSASHGCIRLANWDAAKLAAMIKKGMAVEIH